MSDSEDPIVSWHAGQRWDERTPPTSISPESAWQTGVRITGPERVMGGDETRVHRPTGTVLLRVSSTIATVVTERELQADVHRDVQPILNGGSA